MEGKGTGVGRDEKKHPEPKVRTVNGSAQGDKVEQEMMSLEAHGRQKKKKQTTNNFCVYQGEKITGRKTGGYNQFCNLVPNNQMWL